MLEKIRSWFSSKKSPVDVMTVEFDNYDDFDPKLTGWYIINGRGEDYAGPYKREQDAKGQLTRLRKGYTPAARKV